MHNIFNRFLGCLSFSYRLPKLLSKPSVYAIETSNVCNLKCIMCPRSEMTRPLGNMDFELFKKVINQCKDYTSFIWLQGMGEPFLDKNIFKAVEYAHQNGIRVGISTNATILSEDISKQVLKSRLDHLILCLDGVSKETYENIRVNAKFDLVVDNIKRFLEIKNNCQYKKPYTILQIIDTNLNMVHLGEFKNQWANYPAIDSILVKEFKDWGNQLKESNEIGTPGHKSRNEKLKPPCFHLWNAVTMLQDGTVSACCKDFNGQLALGNLNNETLDSIWNGEKMISLRKMHIKQNFPAGHICQTCFEYPLAYPSKLILNKPNIKLFVKKIADCFKGMGI